MNQDKNHKTTDFVQFYLRLIGFVTVFLGVILLLWPTQISNLFFNDIDLQAQFFARITESTLVGYSVLNILASRDKNLHMQEFAVWGNLSTLLIASIVTLSYYGRFDNYGWLLITQHIVFGGGFVICALKLKFAKNNN